MLQHVRETESVGALRVFCEEPDQFDLAMFEHLIPDSRGLRLTGCLGGAQLTFLALFLQDTLTKLLFRITKHDFSLVAYGVRTNKMNNPEFLPVLRRGFRAKISRTRESVIAFSLARSAFFLLHLAAQLPVQSDPP